MRQSASRLATRIFTDSVLPSSEARAASNWVSALFSRSPTKVSSAMSCKLSWRAAARGWLAGSITASRSRR
ncbi:hypothetical protein D3C72_2274290 [compost metagenome]